MTPRNFLVRGLLAGLIAGILTFAVAYIAGEPSVDAAIQVEAAGEPASHSHEATEHSHEEGAAEHSHDEEGGTVVSRQNQSTWGLLTATVSTGVALGGIVALAAAFALGRIGRLRPSQSTALVAALGFVSVALVPFIKYPATPPAVGDAETIGARTTQYFVMLAISVIAMIAVVLLFRALVGRLGTYTAVLVSAATYLAVVILAAQLMPTVNEIGDFPADTLWYFRRGSLMTLATLWGILGIALTGLIGKLYAEESLTAARKDLAASL
ncbi:CbtA family protein [Aeromicrobium sp.]|uniref:CbtA family protein n=1 Tax=Aeromicrobium sp. TaxID=1871063 RepID=UPI002FCB6CB7